MGRSQEVAVSIYHIPMLHVYNILYTNTTN